MRYANRVLILFAHPAFQKSRVNKQLVAAIRNLEGITFRDLYEEYPDLDIDVKKEQDLLKQHDVVVFQHPFYWYSTPAILKEWCDLVLEYGFAYGIGGTSLTGKVWIHAITTGGHESSYQPQGINRFTVRQFLAPLDQTAHLCGMYFLPPFIVHSTHRMDPQKEIPAITREYQRFIEFLRDNRTPWEKLK
jgi:glutathione-regulated potassium-efflux system ancillary protein KefG